MFTTDLTLEIPQIVKYYRQRWQIETAFRDAKQHFGFDGYQVKSRESINREGAVKFRRCFSNEVDIRNRRIGAERNKC